MKRKNHHRAQLKMRKFAASLKRFVRAGKHLEAQFWKTRGSMVDNHRRNQDALLEFVKRRLKESSSSAPTKIICIIASMLFLTSCQPDYITISGKQYEIKERCVRSHWEMYNQAVPRPGGGIMLVPQWQNVCDEYTIDTILVNTR